jgi:hypothetical protein
MFGLLNQARCPQKWDKTLCQWKPLQNHTFGLPQLVTNGWPNLQGRQEARHLIAYPEIKYG